MLGPAAAAAQGAELAAEQGPGQERAELGQGPQPPGLAEQERGLGQGRPLERALAEQAPEQEPLAQGQLPQEQEQAQGPLQQVQEQEPPQVQEQVQVPGQELLLEQEQVLAQVQVPGQVQPLVPEQGRGPGQV